MISGNQTFINKAFEVIIVLIRFLNFSLVLSFLIFLVILDLIFMIQVFFSHTKVGFFFLHFLWIV